MRCDKCKAYLPFDTKQKNCPACGEPIKGKPIFEDMFNLMAEFAADRNFVYWAFVSLIFWAVVGVAEFALSEGLLFAYFEKNIFHSLVLFVFWGFVVEVIAKINAQIRIASRTLILKERRNLRIFRIGTNLSLLFGLLLALAFVGPRQYFSHFPGITMLAISCVCFFWALEGFYFREEHFEDHRVRNFFFLIGVRHPHNYRVAAAWYVAGFIFSAVIYFALTMFPTIFWGIYNTWFVQSTIKAIKGFLVYFPF